jgi:hypothetical protein
MEPKRTLHSGNLVRGFHVGDRKLFMEKYYDPEKYMELGTCFVREDGKVFILLRDGVHKIDGRKKNELGRLGDFRSKISYKRRGAFYKEASRCRSCF